MKATRLIMAAALVATCVAAHYTLAHAQDSDEHMRAALDVNLPNYAGVIVTADEIVRLLPPAP